MHVRRLRVPWHANRADSSLAAQSKTQHHDQRQGQAVPAQLNGLPAVRLIPDLPAIRIATQAAKRLRVCEQDLSWQHPGSLRQTTHGGRQTDPERYGKKAQRTQREQLGQQIRRQQLP